MSNEQEVALETPTVAETDNEVKLEEVQKEEPENTDDAQDESQADESQKEGETEEEQKPKTVEERLAEIESKYEEKSRAAEAMQKKIDRQTAAYNELQRKLQEERAQIQAKLNDNQEQAQEPNIDDYDSHDDYVNAVADYRAEQRVKAKERELLEKQQQEVVQKLAQERAQTALQQEAEYLKENPRYKASKSEFESFISTANVPPEVERAFVETAFLGNVPEIIDYFGANNGERLGELEAIAKMSPYQVAIEVYKIQQKLSSKPKEETKKPLPKPVVVPKGQSKASKSGKAMSPQELVAWAKS